MEEKRLPDLCTKKDTCCGCSACVTICPVCAISMCPDEKGFLYPLVNSGKCIRCYKCEQICPFKNFDYPEKPLKYKHIRRISD